MSVKIATVALFAGALSASALSVPASARSYGGGPTCGVSQEYDTVNQRCVWVGARGNMAPRANRIRPWVGYDR